MEVNAKQMGSLENAIINDHDSTDATQTGQSSNEASLPHYIQDALLKSLDNAQKLGRKFSFSQAITERAASHLRQLYRKNSRMCPKVAAAASVYTACRQEGNARSMKELCSASKIGLGKLGKAYKEIARILEIQLDRFTADDFIPRFCADLSKYLKV